MSHANVFAHLADGVEASAAVALATATAAVVVFAFLLWREKRRMYRTEHRLCRNCGYDLRAAVEDCPECGWPIRLAVMEREAPLDLLAMSRDWPEAPVDPPRPTGAEVFVGVHLTTSWSEADLLVQQFRVRGLLAVVDREEQSQLSGPYVRSFNQFTVAVPADDELRARTVLRQFQQVPS